MKSYQTSLLTLVGIFGFMVTGYGAEVVVPVADAAVPAVVLDTPAVVANPAVVATPVDASPLAIAPVARPFPAAILPTGQAVSTETRAPDGSIITVTKYNGQLPHGIFQQHYPGFWSPFGMPLGGLHRPFYNYPL